MLAHSEYAVNTIIINAHGKPVTNCILTDE